MLLALVDDRLRRPDADTLKRTQTEAHTLALHRKIGLALVDVRLQDKEIFLLQIDDVFGNLVDFFDAVVQDRREELFGIKSLQICRAVCENRVAGRVRFIEGIARKTLHIAEYLFGYFLRYAAGDCPLDVSALLDVAEDKLILLRHQLRLVFLAHRAADEVCLPEREPRKILEDLHDLFLIDDNAVGDF